LVSQSECKDRNDNSRGKTGEDMTIDDNPFPSRHGTIYEATKRMRSRLFSTSEAADV
jgi:hypothetical protein